MDTQRKCGITASDIDAMTGEELLQLAKAQGQYVGRRLSTEEKGGAYAQMYGIQSQYYKNGTQGEEAQGR